MGPAGTALSRVTAAGIAGVGVTALAVAALLSPATVAAGPELCPFRRMTGLPCPGCGLTRSWVALAHGDLGSAVAFNLFGPVFMAAAVIVTVAAVWVVIRGRPVVDRLSRAVTHPLTFGAVAVWFGYGLVRTVDAATGWGIFPAITS